MPVMIPAYYYAQQGADPNAQFPALTFGGWNKTQIPIDLKRKAVIVMHVWKVPESAALLRHVEYLSRANAIVRDRFPSFLQAARRSGIRIIHVAAGFEMVDMTRYGLMFSIVGDMTTAVENKKSCVDKSNQEYGLWQFAVQSGFVLLSEELKASMFLQT